jgi:hypothetical protein
MLTLGEVHTGLLQHTTALTPMEVARVLNLREGERVLLSQRPTAYAVSPDLLSGVDCYLPSASGRRVRGTGTVASRAIITGGRVLQGSSYTTIARSKTGRRLPWSHYLSRPGQMEVVGKVDWSDVQSGFVSAKAPPDSLNLGGVSARALDIVQQSGRLDRRPPFRARRTCLRWVLAPDPKVSDADGVFTVHTDTLRTLELRLAPDNLDDAIALCEDLALHDWLLSTMVTLLDRTRTSPRPTIEKSSHLRPAVEHLMHLWMPGARLADEVLPVWAALEQRPGFTRQWETSVNWIRDQIAIATMELLETVVATDPAVSRA